MVEHLITGLMLVVAAIHFFPITGFFGRRRLQTLYGIDIHTGDLEILMRHRAILFGMLGAFLAYAAFVPGLLPVAFAAAAISLAPFFFLSATVDTDNPAIRKIVVGDIVAAVCLVAAIILYLV